MKGKELQARLERLALAVARAKGMDEPISKTGLAKILGCSTQQVFQMMRGTYTRSVRERIVDSIIEAEAQYGYMAKNNGEESLVGGGD